MKKLIIIILCMTAGITAQAQYKEGVPVTENGIDVDKVVLSTQYTSLLDREDQLLKSRTAALIVTSVGVGTGIATGFITTGTPAYRASFMTCALCTITGSVWLVVNQFQLINIRRKENSKQKLLLTPTSLSYNF